MREIEQAIFFFVSVLLQGLKETKKKSKDVNLCNSSFFELIFNITNVQTNYPPLLMYTLSDTLELTNNHEVYANGMIFVLSVLIKSL
jgi:hypothetical protein